MICNGWIIPTNGGFGLLQMVSESDTERFAGEDVGPLRVDCEILLERGTKHFF